MAARKRPETIGLEALTARLARWSVRMGTNHREIGLWGLNRVGCSGRMRDERVRETSTRKGWS